MAPRSHTPRRGPRSLSALGFVAALAVAVAATVAACFDPLTPACPFACGPDNACPAAYVCAADGLCHREDTKGGQSACTAAPPDSGAD
jgi:hypothetical protein